MEQKSQKQHVTDFEIYNPDWLIDWLIEQIALARVGQALSRDQWHRKLIRLCHLISDCFV